LRRRRVRFTATAREHVTREQEWWLENRPHVDVFAAELAEALRILATVPGVGKPYPRPGTAGVRRLYIRKLTAHLYYTFDDQGVIVRALWGARRQRAPRL
jgi:plasmid stabilization system protein ParE